MLSVELPAELRNSVRLLSDDIIFHDLKNFLNNLSIILYRAGCTKTTELTTIPTRGPSSFINFTDEKLMQLTQRFSQVESTLKEANLFPYIPIVLTMLKDSAGHLVSIHDNHSEEKANMYLERLEKRTMPLKPLCDFFNAHLKIEQQNPAGFYINGLEFIIISNLCNNAKNHSPTCIQIENHRYNSIVSFNPQTREFTVTSISEGKNKQEICLTDKLLSLAAMFNRYGLFISSIYAKHLRKELCIFLRPEKFFVCEVKTPVT